MLAKAGIHSLEYKDGFPHSRERQITTYRRILKNPGVVTDWSNLWLVGGDFSSIFAEKIVTLYKEC